MSKKKKRNDYLKGFTTPWIFFCVWYWYFTSSAAELKTHVFVY